MESAGRQAAEEGGQSGIPGLLQERHDDQGGIPPLADDRLAIRDAGMDQWGEGEVRRSGRVMGLLE